MAHSEKVVWLTQGHSFWDMTLLQTLLEGYDGNRRIFVVPGAISDPDEVNKAIELDFQVMVIVTSDEENKFDVSRLSHPDLKVYVSYPTREKHSNVTGYLPIGYAPGCKELVKEAGIGEKTLDWFFSGQVTNPHRRSCVEALQGTPNGELVATEGFAQGLEYSAYMKLMCKAKVIPCPAGPFSPDSFRLYEALEAGCIPIVQDRDFWTLLFGEVPFPVVSDWDNIQDLINHFKDRPDVANRCSAWWQLKKRELKWILQS